MRYIGWLIPLILVSYSTFGADASINSVKRPTYYTFEASPLTKNNRKMILENEIYARSAVASFTGKILHPKPKPIENIDMQKFSFAIAGLHKKSCRIALKKLKYYENYKQYLGFVENSSYGEKDSRVHLSISHSILPIDMVLYFILPRISKPGVYPFKFDVGFLKDLHGQIHVSKYKNRCYFFAIANWKGPHTGFADSLFEFFSKGMGVIAMENLFRISGGI